MWTPGEIRQTLGEELGERFCRRYGVTEEGNFEGKNILNRIHVRETPGDPEDGSGAEDELAEARARLLALRRERVHPKMTRSSPAGMRS